MKIYHTKTQEDYDALMRELGYEGGNGWLFFERDTHVLKYADYVSHTNSLAVLMYHPNEEIIEYTARKTNMISAEEWAKQFQTVSQNIQKTLKSSGESANDNVNSLIKSVSNDNEELYRKIIQELKQTYLAKNKDYGNSFEQSLDEHGEIAGVVRIGDKFNRAKTLVKKECDVLDESKVDTYLDMANYCIMQAMWLIKQEE